MSAAAAPFRVREIYKAKNWGGRRLESVAGKTLPPGEAVGESWEVADVGDDVSVVQGGPWDGRTLRALATEETAALYGPGRLAPGRFPLLVKFLDAVQPLSIQVHPDDGTALQLGAPSGKTEAWVVLAAEPGAELYRGLKPDVTRDALAALVEAGRVAEALHAIPAEAGDAVFVPPGTVHAIGGGIVLYEIQQAADVTYRLDDWGRMGSDGRPRPLQVQEALASVATGQPCLDKRVPALLNPGDELLVACDKFTLRRWLTAQSVDAAALGAHCLTVVAGQGRCTGAFGEVAAPLGATLVIPHGAGRYRWEPEEDAVALCAACPALGDPAAPLGVTPAGGPTA